MHAYACARTCICAHMRMWCGCSHMSCSAASRGCCSPAWRYAHARAARAALSYQRMHVSYAYVYGGGCTLISAQLQLARLRACQLVPPSPVVHPHGTPTSHCSNPTLHGGLRLVINSSPVASNQVQTSRDASRHTSRQNESNHVQSRHVKPSQAQTRQAKSSPDTSSQIQSRHVHYHGGLLATDAPLSK